MKSSTKPTLTRKFRGLPLAARARERRERLIDAGITTLGTHGYHAVTVRVMCKEAQLTERYFYESFKNMEELFLAVFSHIDLGLRHRTMHAIMTAERAPEAIVRAYLRAYFEYLREDARRARILLQESMSVSPEVLRVTLASARGHTTIFDGVLHSLFPDGKRGEFLTQGLLGATINIAFEWTREGFASPLEDVLEGAVAIYRGVLLLGEEERDKLTPAGDGLEVTDEGEPTHMRRRRTRTAV